MAYRLVYGDFWSDPKVMEEMEPQDRYFYLYLLTNPQTTTCGIYRITKKQMAFELGYSIEEVNDLMDKFENNYKLVRYVTDTRELAIKNWGKYNLNRGGKPVMDCLASELSKVKDKNLIQYVLRNISNEIIKQVYISFYAASTNSEEEDVRLVDNTYTSTNTSTKREKEIDANTEKEINIDLDKSTGTGKNANIVTAAEKGTSVNTEGVREEEAHKLSLSLIQEYEKLTGYIGALSLAAVKIAIIDHGLNNVKMAINRALERGKFSMSYVNGILKTWAREGYPEEGEYDGNRSTCKNNGSSKNEFSGFKPPEPRSLTEEERRVLEKELL
jgi:DnaD/phage-associated family protein